MYSPAHIGKCLSQKRLGGICHFNFCGTGETMMYPYITQITKNILEEGHYIMIVTNGTLTGKLKQMFSFESSYKSRLGFKFSFHYLELKKRNLLNTFFSNVQLCGESGCSYSVEITPSDELEPYIDEIKEVSIKHFGALPHITIPRIEDNKTVPLLSKHDLKTFKSIWDTFNSGLLDFKYSIWGIKRREYCHAGRLSALLNIATGELGACYGFRIHQNIFADISKPIQFIPVKNCKMPHCYNGHSFLALGNIFSINSHTYAEVRNRKCSGIMEGKEWLTPGMKLFLTNRLDSKTNNAQNILFAIQRTGYFFYQIFLRGIKKCYGKLVSLIGSRITPMWDYQLFYLFSKANISKYEHVINDKKIFLFLASDYGNLGDIAITICQEKLLSAAFPGYKTVVIPSGRTLAELKTLKKISGNDDIITVIGGGNTGNMYVWAEKRREFIIKTFPGNKIILFPQSIACTGYKGHKNFSRRLTAVYGKHKHLLMLLRDMDSFTFTKKYLKYQNISLVPDIVMTLKYRRQSNSRDGVILCLRNDQEKALNSDNHNIIHQFACDNFNNVNIYDLFIEKRLIFNDYKMLLQDTLHNFSRSQLVITDRLHGMVFAFITGTPAIILPNFNSKIEKSFEWIRNCKFIGFTNDINYGLLQSLKDTVCHIDINTEDIIKQQIQLEEIIIKNIMTFIKDNN
jgi:exopolysaccharide biosynthesis predicted pyruvyltransferase EpsI